MPGLDGTGPRGMGPMTGRGRGFCVLRLPRGPGKPIIGSAGWPGRPVAWPLEGQTDLAQLRSHARHIEAVLTGIRSRIERLEAKRRQEAVGG